jgi:uncharacterized protein (DUF433 family)/predicted RNase H-like HicB family nuclease
MKNDPPRYEIILCWSDEDATFIAEVPKLPGCAADGRTYAEALRNVQRAIAQWIEVARELDRPIPQPRGRLRGGTEFAEVDYRDRIILDPNIRFGKPTVRGTRITVGDVLSYLAGGMSESEILADFPDLSQEDIRAVLAFAAARERREYGQGGYRIKGVMGH